MTDKLNQQLIQNASNAFKGVPEGHHMVAIEYDLATQQIVFITNTNPQTTNALVEHAYVKMHTPKGTVGMLTA